MFCKIIIFSGPIANAFKTAIFWRSLISDQFIMFCDKYDPGSFDLQ